MCDGRKGGCVHNSSDSLIWSGATEVLAHN